MASVLHWFPTRALDAVALATSGVGQRLVPRPTEADLFVAVLAKLETGAPLDRRLLRDGVARRDHPFPPAGTLPSLVVTARNHDLDKLEAGAAEGIAVVFDHPGATFRDELVADLAGDDPRSLSIESSVAVSGDTAYFQNSGGLVQGWDLSSLRTGVGEVHRTFRYWTGDDGDSTIVVDDEGFLYVGVQVDRDTDRAREVGQLIKLNPRKADDPVVWSIDVNKGVESGTWATPVVLDDVVLEVVVVRLRSRVGVLEGFARVNDRVVVEGTMTFALASESSSDSGDD